MIESGPSGDGDRAARKDKAAGYARLALTQLGILAIDQASKLAAVKALKPYGTVSTPLGRLLSFTLVYNDGAAFGMLSGKLWVMMALALAFASGLIIFWGKVRLMGKAAVVGATMMLAGALGNFVDRARLGYVIDFIEVPMVPLFQVFNLADAFLVIGTAVFIAAMLRSS